MKKPSKCDFKKLALLGITGGTVLASQATATDLNQYSQLLAFNGCGGSNAGCGGNKGGVGSSGSSSGYQAYRTVPSSTYYYTNEQSGQNYQSYPYSGQSGQWQQSQPGSHCNSPSHCNGQSGPYYQSYPNSGQYYQSSPNYYPSYPTYPSTGYPSASQPYYPSSAQQYQPSQPTAGCGGNNTPAWQQTAQQNWQPSQPTAGCGGNNTPAWQQTAQQNWQPVAPQNLPSQDESASAWGKKAYSSWETSKLTAEADEKPNTQRLLTENELLSQLNDQAKATYQSLDAAGKALALKLANQGCKGRNSCKGLNSCKTEEHACAGKGSCAGTAISNFKDKNLAVKVAALKMAEKRVKATSPK